MTNAIEEKLISNWQIVSNWQKAGAFKRGLSLLHRHQSAVDLVKEQDAGIQVLSIK